MTLFINNVAGCSRDFLKYAKWSSIYVWHKEMCKLCLLLCITTMTIPYLCYTMFTVRRLNKGSRSAISVSSRPGLQAYVRRFIVGLSVEGHVNSRNT